MHKLVVTLGALLLAAPVFSQGARSEHDAPVFSQGARSGNDAPVFSQSARSGNDVPVSSQEKVVALKLTETREQLTKIMGPPALVQPSGDLESWQYQIDVEDHHDFSHAFLFRISTGQLISATQTLEPAKPLDELFPEAETRVYHYPDAQHPQFSVRLRKLDGGRLLLALGSEKQGAPVAQIMLIRESELPRFHSWLSDQMKSE